MANHHHILSVPLAPIAVLLLVGFSSFFFLPPSIGGPPSPDAATTTTIANEPLQPMTTNKLFNTFASCFQNQCSGAIRYLFKPTGFATWHNVGAGNVTLTGFSVGGQSRSVSAFSNSTTIDYRITVPNVVTMDVYFKETPTNGRPSNTFKVTMIGTSSVSGTFTWNFGNPQAFPVTCNNTKHILTYGTAGLNFTDSVNFSATCTTTSVSFTIGVGAFKIDPSTVATSSLNSATLQDKDRRLYGPVQGRFWFFYFDGTNEVWKSSTNGQTWSSATTIRAGSSGQALDTYLNYTTNRIYYVFQPSAGGTSLPWRSGILNSDGTITWDFAEQTITTTGTIDNVGTGSVHVITTPHGDLLAAVETTQTAVVHIEVWKCANAASSCTPTKINDILQSTICGSTNVPFIILAFSDNKLAFVCTSAATGGHVSTCPSTCASSGDWSSFVSTTAITLGNPLSAITVGTTLYFVARAGGTTIKYETCAYPCSSTPTEATITSSLTTLAGLSIETDGGSTLVVVFADSGMNKVGHFISLNSGSTWSTAITDISSESNIVFNSVTGNDKIISNVVLIGWTAGTANPFNIRSQIITLNTPFIIQSTSCTGTGSTVNCAFASNTKAGSSLVVFAGSTATTTISGVTDTQSLTYSQIVGSDVGTVGDSEAWWACHPSTAAADTVTVSYSLSVTATIILYELHGRPTGTSCSPSSSTGSSASSSTAAVGSYTPRANAFIIGALDSSCQVACTITAGSGYSLDFNVAINAVNDFTTEYFWNVATADTTPYTFSVASAYNEISVAFYDLVWNNNTLADSATPSETILRTPTPLVTDSLSLSDKIPILFKPSIADSISLAETAFRGAIVKLTDAFNIIVTIPISPGGIAPPGLLVPQPDYTAYFAMAIMFIFVVLILIKKRR